MKMAKLPSYFPSTSVRSLQKSKFEMTGDKVFSEEEKLLHEKVAEFKSADQKTRLTSENYHPMMKLMLQMEDETESAKCLSYDQDNKAIVHVRESIYSLKIVSEKSLGNHARDIEGEGNRVTHLRTRFHIQRTAKIWTRPSPSTHAYG